MYRDKNQPLETAKKETRGEKNKLTEPLKIHYEGSVSKFSSKIQSISTKANRNRDELGFRKAQTLARGNKKRSYKVGTENLRNGGLKEEREKANKGSLIV